MTTDKPTTSIQALTIKEEDHRIMIPSTEERFLGYLLIPVIVMEFLMFVFSALVLVGVL